MLNPVLIVCPPGPRTRCVDLEDLLALRKQDVRPVVSNRQALIATIVVFILAEKKRRVARPISCILINGARICIATTTTCVRRVMNAIDVLAGRTGNEVEISVKEGVYEVSFFVRGTLGGGVTIVIDRCTGDVLEVLRDQ